MTIQEFQQEAAIRLEHAGVLTARLDTLLLLGDVLGQDKSWVIAHPEAKLTTEQLTTLGANLARRVNREPMAYIRGMQEFYGRNFAVTPATLIPRPESELGIELLKKLPLPKNARIIDVGTGSGCLGITAALELPGRKVTLVDISREALAVAQQNAHAHGIQLTVLQSDLLAKVTSPADVIIANLPYVSRVWTRSPETAFEPALALFAEDDGLQLMYQLLHQAARILAHGGTLLLEADPRQHPLITAEAKRSGYQHIQTNEFWLQCMR